MKKISPKEQKVRVTMGVILQEANNLLACRGFDLMTMDEVAAAVGIGKPSLYRHFSSKEELAAAAMAHLLERVLEVINAQPADALAIDKMRGVLRWALEQHVLRAMPLLPSTRSTLREALLRYPPYVERLAQVAAALSEWIDEARQRAELADLPTEVVLYTLFARTCDPVLEYLQLGGALGDDQIVDMLLQTTFYGLCRR
jgi:AcrR family transcriptional regulator